MKTNKHSVGIEDRTVYSHFNPANPTACVGFTEETAIQDVRKAVLSAKQAQIQWKNRSSLERGDFLQKAADILEKDKDEIAAIATKEMGKRFVEMVGEVLRGAAILRYYAQEGTRGIGEILPSHNPANTLYSLRVPVGVVAAITPWNFPVAIPVWKIAPALVYGNTVVLKPSQESSMTAKKIAEVFHLAGIPNAVLQIVYGDGDTVGNELVEHPAIAAITFTGSNSVGRKIASKSVEHNKKYQLELGGKNPVIVLEDANLNLAAKRTIEGAMKQTGQRCTGTSVAYVVNEIYHSFVEKLLDEVKQIKVGDGFNSSVGMGPIASKKQFDKVLAYIAKGVDEGAELLYGGGKLAGADYNGGYFVEPTIFGGVTKDMTIAKEEIFGPVLCIIKVQNYAEALVKANDNMYGLSASLFTTNLDQALHFIQNSEVGLVQINGETGGAEPQAPFGGMKESSSGSRKQGQAAKEFFTTYKTVTISPSAQ
ncbi:aldehyde dehydrogenase family protein [Cytobacillus horneckiae]|uniref:aldehyde dehydrogenase family protein n=1 Tax=Cytobacillus horneckiae TaxID=549687 RepID=UPI00203FAD6F|nr:aldehyde dehydrogenase family protein [Cytobacillus horneckiae]MCM3179558.1 aldehyde dehydrogenase family protein [Cytobacillus horneckiae]